MKRSVIILFLVAAVGAGFIFRDELNVYRHKLVARLSDELPGLEQVAFDFSEKAEFEIGNLQREVSAPGPLRGNENNPDALLTVSGTVEQTNYQRTLLGLPPYEANEMLNEAARRKVQSMFEGQYFEHISPDGVTPGELIEAAGYEYLKVGENLALGNYADDKDLVMAWMASPPHRENILHENYTQVGVAVGRGIFEGEMTWLAVQEFGRPMSLCPSVDKDLVFQIDHGQEWLAEMEITIEALREDLRRSKPVKQAGEKEIEEYNAKVDEYNKLVREYNAKGEELKQLADKYNVQVKAFNYCLNE